MLSIIVPVYNEKKYIKFLLKKLIDLKELKKQIIIVDDGSYDGTTDILKNKFIRSKFVNKIIFHKKNIGKGAAIKSAQKYVKGDYVAIQDADLEYDPTDYGILLAPILDGRADVVYGSRFQGGTHRVLFFWHYLGNKFLTTLSNMFTNLNLTDMETGYKVFTKKVNDTLTFKCNRFGFEPEFTAKVAKNKFRIYEVPISYSGRDYSEGKKITWKDGFAAIWYICKYRFTN